MATRVFADDELERLRGFPEINKEELIRFFTLTPADMGFIDPGRGRSPKDRIGLAVQLCTLPWLGFVPDDVASAPAAAVERLSEHLRIPMGELLIYGQRQQTRTDHLQEVTRYLNWKPAKELQLKELDEFLLARAMEHDSPSLLFRLACEHLAAARVLRPGVVKLLERVAAARAAAGRETYQRVKHLLTPKLMTELDGLLVVDPVIGATRLNWLSTGATGDSANAVKGELEKLGFLRGMDAHALDLTALPAERRRFLAQVGRRLNAQSLDRREPQRRHPILLTVLAQSAADVLDEVIGLFDQAVSARESRARTNMRDELAARATAGEGRQALLDEILPLLLDPAIEDEQVGGRLRNTIGLQRLRAAMAGSTPRLPRDHGHLAMLDGSYSYLRQFTPEVLRTITFKGGPGAESLMEAVRILKELNATGARKVPDDAPFDFVPVRWAGYLEQSAKSKDATAYRHFWELTVLLGLRDGLRSGDVYVPSSRRYADPASYLFTPEQWTGQRTEFCRLVGKPAAGRAALEACKEELEVAIGDLEKVLGNRAAGVGEVRLSDKGELIIPPLSAEDVPAEAAALREELSELLPLAPIASLLVELDRRTGFLDRITHAGGKQTRTPELKRNLLAVLIANATNLGLVRMAQACGISYDILAWTQEWYIREETLAAANAEIVNYHHRLPMTQVFGGGTLSSSDGQRFPVQGKSTTARPMKKYFAGHGLSTYTHVSDQHSTFGTKVIVVTRREAHYVLDEIMGNKTDLPITEHATDTHGVTLVNFALFDLVGMQLSPRIRDLGKITLYRMDPQREVSRQWPVAGPLLTQKINLGLIEENWDDLLRLAASIKFGHATASLIVGKLSASSRQNTLAAALKEYGALRRTIYSARYLADPAYRRKISRQLNKGESLHSLRRDLHYAHQGKIRERFLAGQTEQAWCLTVLTNAVVTWTTEYFGLAVEQMRAEGRAVDDELLAYISPAHSENVNYHGMISVEVDSELAKLDPAGFRPLGARRPQRS
ncbi:MAG: Tn3 family transposase [Dermatophilaceae bacterium]